LHVSILDYGVGNIYSLQAALRREKAQPQLVTDVHDSSKADALLLPGVGSFKEVAEHLPRAEILEIAKSGKPVIGICLGLQLFFDKSDEGPGEGLSVLPGRVKRLPSIVKVPQIGWNILKIQKTSELVEGLADNSWVYFLHSYYPPLGGDWVVATTEYGVEYPTLIEQKNFLGAQFHPEKSGKAGRIVLRNILRLIRR
jgi:glutamine amidotransferase